MNPVRLNACVCLCMRVYLQIEVCDSLGVQVLDSVEDLFDKLSGLLLAERLLLRQEIEQLSSRHPGLDTHTHTRAREHLGLILCAQIICSGSALECYLK